METFEKMPEDSTILEYCYSKPDMLYYVCRMVLEGFINLETGECAFDSKEFRTMLEFVNSFPQEVDLSGNINDEIWDRARSGRQMLSMALIGSILDIQRLDAMYSSRTSFPGFPTADGSVGSYFDIGGQELVMSVSCKNKGAAWEFIREKFLPSAAPSESPSAENGIPINKSDFKAWLKFPESGYDVSIGSMEYSYHVPTQEEAARIVNLFNNVNKFQMSSPKVFSIVKEQCGPYFAGDKTLDETVDLVQRRVSLYVSEMR